MSAGRRLEMLPSALGRFIRLLEEDLGTRLMTRTTRSVTLTNDGTTLLKEARTLLAQGLQLKFVHGLDGTGFRPNRHPDDAPLASRPGTVVCPIARSMSSRSAQFTRP